MKKIIGLFKKKDELDEEVKGQPQEDYKEDLSTKDKETNSNSNSD